MDQQALETWLHQKECSFIAENTVTQEGSMKSRLHGPWPENSTDPVMTLLNHEDTLLISGADSVKFLHGQATCDVEKLPEGKAAPGACCTPNGRMIANFRTVKLSEELMYLTMPSGQAKKLTASLSKYAAFYKVGLALAEHCIRIGICADKETVNKLLQTYEDQMVCFVITATRAEIWASEKDILPLLVSLSKTCRLVSTDYWCLKDIHDGIGWVQPENSGKYLPQEYNLDLTGGINFKKGCYTGQEIVARLHYRGKAKSRLHYFTAETKVNIACGMKLTGTEGRASGAVVSSLLNPVTGKYELLACVRMDQINQGIFLEADGTPLEKQSLPYTIE